MKRLADEVLCFLQAKSQTPQQVVCPAPAAAAEPHLTYSLRWQVAEPLPVNGVRISATALRAACHRWTLNSSGKR